MAKDSYCSAKFLKVKWSHTVSAQGRPICAHEEGANFSDRPVAGPAANQTTHRSSSILDVVVTVL